LGILVLDISAAKHYRSTRKFRWVTKTVNNFNMAASPKTIPFNSLYSLQVAMALFSQSWHKA